MLSLDFVLLLYSHNLLALLAIGFMKANDSALMEFELMQKSLDTPIMPLSPVL